MRAEWKSEVVARSDDTVVVDRNHYFPAGSVNGANLRPSAKTTICPWKGTAHYYDVVVGDDVNQDAAWCYPDPKQAAIEIKDHIAFWRGVVVDADETP